MSELQRRDVLAVTAGLAAAALAAPEPAKAGDPGFMINVPDPLLSGPELPAFKFALEKSEGKVIGGSSPCGSNPGRCVSFTGTQLRPNGRS
jgi:oxalate decarboxylase